MKDDDAECGSQVRLIGSLGALVACPLCGFNGGYTLIETISYRWWDVSCNACGETVTECASDRRTSMGKPLPTEWPAAHEAWNDAGAYANGLRL